MRNHPERSLKSAKDLDYVGDPSTLREEPSELRLEEMTNCVKKLYAVCQII